MASVLARQAHCTEADLAPGTVHHAISRPRAVTVRSVWPRVPKLCLEKVFGTYAFSIAFGEILERCLLCALQQSSPSLASG